MLVKFFVIKFIYWFLQILSRYLTKMSSASPSRYFVNRGTFFGTVQEFFQSNNIEELMRRLRVMLTFMLNGTGWTFEIGQDWVIRFYSRTNRPDYVFSIVIRLNAVPDAYTTFFRPITVGKKLPEDTVFFVLTLDEHYSLFQYRGFFGYLANNFHSEILPAFSFDTMNDELCPRTLSVSGRLENMDDWLCPRSVSVEETLENMNEALCTRSFSVAETSATFSLENMNEALCTRSVSVAETSATFSLENMNDELSPRSL